MIAYRISQNELKDLIEAESPGWLERAAQRTEEFFHKGFYEEESSIWSEVKVVYMRLQGNCKCSYCERKLESSDFGKVEQDVEHFRPKGNIRVWKVPPSIKKNGILFSKVPNEERGYYLLPYHVFNYSAACKPCNSILKKDYFPIAGNYNLQGDDPETLLAELPYLVCPIGDFDSDPETLIRFHGVSPQVVAEGTHDRARALVTIEFFKLDDESRRKNLFLERARIIVTLYPLLVNIAELISGELKETSEQLINAFTSPSSPHTNCARSYKDLFFQDRNEAKAIFNAASNLIIGNS